MRASLVALLIMCVSVGGCAAVPKQEDVTRVSSYEIVQRARCEARRAVLDSDREYYLKYPGKAVRYENATVGYDFEFSITEGNYAKIDAGWGLAYPLGGQFLLDANVLNDRTRETKRTFKVVDTFEQLRATPCEVSPPSHNAIYPIEGDIGLYELVRTFIGLQQIDKDPAGDVFTVSDVLTFTTILSGGIEPKVTIAPLSETLRLARLGGDFHAKRHDIHKVTLSLAGDVREMRRKKRGEMTIAASMRELPPIQTNSSLASITILQATGNPTARALLELDRQRIIALQNRAQNVIVGP